MDQLATLIGQSPGMVAIHAHVRRLLSLVTTARRVPPVLLLGETGTGKGLLARSLHAASSRASGRFVSVNCAAIPETLLEAELFGFERGAFTDARQAKPGLFQEAHGGTLFLDEVGLLPESLQAKLLTALDEREVRRLGGTRTEPTDCWIIAATSADLEQARKERRFREDLYHRLSVFTICLPPLRERGDDVFRLAAAFLDRILADYGLPPRTLDDRARAALQRYTWPGNVRELGNVLERAALLSEGSQIGADMLGLPRDEEPREDVSAAAHAQLASPDLRESLDDLERSKLLQALDRSHWNVALAAEMLGVPRNTLRYRIDKHRLTRPDEPVPRRTLRGRLGRHGVVSDSEGAISHRPERSAIPSGSPSTNDALSESRRRAIFFLRASLAGTLQSVVSQCLPLILEKTRTFGGRILREADGEIDAAFGLEPTEDASARAAYAALAIRRLVEHAENEHPGARLRVAIETLNCDVMETVGGETRLPRESIEKARGALGALIDRIERDVIVGSGAVPHLERHFALATAAVHGQARATVLVRRDSVDAGRSSSSGQQRGPFVDREALGSWDTGLGLPGRRLSPFVGRETELVLLIERLRQVGSVRRGHVVHLMGEPGAGKSRLLLEFRKILATEQTAVLEGSCASYAVTSPYAAMADVLRRAWTLDAAEGRAVARERVRTALRDLGLDPGAVGPYLLALLGIEHDSLLTSLSPEALRFRTFAALEQVLQVHARLGPLVLLMEDLHWMDRTSEAFMASFVESLPGLACLVVITTRPGHHAQWLDRSWASQLALPSLAMADCRRIVGAILSRETDATFVEQVAHRGEGNPFFLEELACAVGGQGPEDPAVSVPATVAAALEARMDRLASEPRRILESAAVIGREAPAEILAAVTQQPIDMLITELQHLVAAEFLYEQPGRVHVFKHALTQEVAYARAPEGVRRRLHAAAGAALEGLHAGRIEEHLDQLSHHFDRSNDHAKAVHYLSLLARRMEANYALQETIETLEHAIGHCADLLPGREANLRVVALVNQMAVPLALLGRSTEIERRLLPHQTLIDSEGDPSLAARFYLSRAIACDFTGRFREAERLEARALREAEQAGDRSTTGQILVLMAQSSLWTCAYREGADRAERSRAYLDVDAGSLWRGMAAWFTTLHLALLGQLGRALDAALQTHTLALSMGDRRMESYGLCLVAWVTGRKGNVKEGLERCRSTLEMAPDANARMVIRCFLGQLAIAAGEVALARKELREGFESCRAAGFGPFAVWNLAWLAVAELHAGDAAGALRFADEALAMANDIDFPLGQGLAYRGRGLALAALRRLDDAAASFTVALETFVTIEAAYDAALCRLDLARVLADKARDAAAGHLTTALSVFEAMGVELDSVGARQVARTLGMTLPTSNHSAVHDSAGDRAPR